MLAPLAPSLELDALQTPALDRQSRLLVSAQDLFSPTDLLLPNATVTGTIPVIGRVQWVNAVLKRDPASSRELVLIRPPVQLLLSLWPKHHWAGVSVACFGCGDLSSLAQGADGQKSQASGLWL